MELDSHSLFRLSERAFKISTEEKSQYYSKILEIVRGSASDEEAASSILEFVTTVFEERKLKMAAGSVNPNSLKPKTPSFRRVGAGAESVFGDKDPVETESGVATESGIIILK